MNTNMYRPQHPAGNMKSLQRCIQENDTKRLSKLLSRKTSLNLGKYDLSFCLCEAITTSKPDCVPPLLASGADPNFVTEEGRTPLHLLLEQGGNPATIKVLLQAGSNPNKASTSTQVTPLHVAAKRGHNVCIRILLSGGARVDKPDAWGNSPLMYAAKEGHLTTVGMLLREDADPNTRNLQNESALHFTSAAGHVDCVHELMNQDASPNIRDESGQTPLFVACKAGHLLVVEALLDYSCDVNAQNLRSGKTVLHWAVQNGDVSLVQILLRRGAEVNVRDNDWETPFMTALNMGRIEVIRLLIQAGCKVTVTDRSFNTALHLAARDGHAELVPILVKAGLDVNLKGAGGLTPLMLACLGGHVSVVDMLLKHGANPDVLDRNRASALMCAIISTAEETSVNAVVKMLIRANCSVDGRANVLNLMKALNLKMDKRFSLDDRLYSPLELAFLKCRIVLFMLLLQAGCKLRHLDLNGLLVLSARETLKGSDLKNCQYLLKCFNREKYDIRPLKEMCRKHALAALGGNVTQNVISRLPVSDQIKRFLAYEDLDHLEHSFNLAFRDKRISSEPSTKLAPINENTSSSPFSRQDRKRQTYHLSGRRSGPSPTPQDSKQRGRRSPQYGSPSSSNPTSPTPSTSTSPTPFARSGSLRIPRNKESKRSASSSSISSASPTPSTPTSQNWPKPRSRQTSSGYGTPTSPGVNNKSNDFPFDPVRSPWQEVPTKPERIPRKRLGSPDTGYSSTCSSCADCTSPTSTSAIGFGRKDRNGAVSPEAMSPGGLSKWSTQDDVNSLMSSMDNMSVASMPVNGTPSTPRSRIPVFQKSPSPMKYGGSVRDDIATARAPVQYGANISNFTRSRSFRKY